MSKKLVRAKKSSYEPPQRRVRAFTVGEGLPSLPDLTAELQDMTDVLLGRDEPPIQAGILTLMEIASAYHARALEIQTLLHEQEREGKIIRGSAHYKFRTGELRSFIDLAKGAADLGSRRITAEDLEFKRATYGRDL